MNPTPIRVFIVDDSAFARDMLVAGLRADPGLAVVGQAADAAAAGRAILELRPDVVTLDVEMPGVNGVEFLRWLMPQLPVPVVMVSAFTRRGQRITLDALEAGAVDFVAKPDAATPDAAASMLLELRTKIKIAATARLGHWKRPPATAPPVAAPRPATGHAAERLVAIGASTGGTEAIRAILEALPPTTPGVAIVQHMPPGFTRLYADRLNDTCRLRVKEAADGDRLEPGRALIAPGGQHLRVVATAGGYAAEVRPGAPVNGHCPSVDVLLFSVAEQVGPRAVGVILTGMGRDGAAGLRALRDRGARCFAQDEATSVIFGMPLEAHRRGGAERLVPLGQMAETILAALTAGPRQAEGTAG